MPFVYSNVDALDNTPKVGGGQCARLVQHYIPGIGVTTSWRAGAEVVGNTTLARGTAIATFVNGRYPNQDHGNHVAIYVMQDAVGVWVVDQWTNKPLVSKRCLLRRGKNSDGTFIMPSDNAEAFSVIEHS